MDLLCFLGFFCLRKDHKNLFFCSTIAVWSCSRVKKPDPHPRISASARNDLFPRVQRGKGLGTSHLISHAPAHTHTVTQGRLPATNTGVIIKPHSSSCYQRIQPTHTDTHTHLLLPSLPNSYKNSIHLHTVGGVAWR